MTKKQKINLINNVLKHWDIMIGYVETKSAHDDVSATEMLRDIKQNWQADYCWFCKYQIKINFFLRCSECLLGIYYGECGEINNNLWRRVDSSKTWGDWIENAKKFRIQIESLKNLEKL